MRPPPRHCGPGAHADSLPLARPVVAAGAPLRASRLFALFSAAGAPAWLTNFSGDPEAPAQDAPPTPSSSPSLNLLATGSKWRTAGAPGAAVAAPVPSKPKSRARGRLLTRGEWSATESWDRLLRFSLARDLPGRSGRSLPGTGKWAGRPEAATWCSADGRRAPDKRPTWPVWELEAQEYLSVASLGSPD